MIYTYDKNTLKVEAFSDDYNQYSNENWVDFEYDSAPADEWKISTGKYLKFNDDKIILEDET